MKSFVSNLLFRLKIVALIVFELSFVAFSQSNTKAPVEETFKMQSPNYDFIIEDLRKRLEPYAWHQGEGRLASFGTFLYLNFRTYGSFASKWFRSIEEEQNDLANIIDQVRDYMDTGELTDLQKTEMKKIFDTADKISDKLQDLNRDFTKNSAFLGTTATLLFTNLVLLYKLRYV